jgi:hypothetical protein
MPDKFTEVTTTGYGKRIMDSIGGIVIGLILFIASFFVLYNNEGSFDYSQIAKTAVEINSAQEVSDPALAGKLLVTSGVLASDEMLDDGQYLKPGKYLALDGKNEMYAWVEKKSTTSQKNTGGSETSTTTYDYVKQWTGSPAESSSFKYPEGHGNPPMTASNVNKKVGRAAIGIYNVEMQSISMPGLTPVNLNAENTNLPAAAAAAPTTQANATQQPTAQVQPASIAMQGKPQLVGGTYVYVSKNSGSSYEAPQVGDVRTSYSAFNSGTNVTLYGRLNDKTFVAFVDKDNHKLFEIFLGTKEEAVSQLHQSYVMWKWIWRGIGFFMMWVGLGMILGPISVVADVLPILGSISGSIIGVVTFIVSLVLSGVTILIAMLFHNVIALVVAIVVIIAGAYFVLQGRKKPTTTAPDSPAAADIMSDQAKTDGPK